MGEMSDDNADTALDDSAAEERRRIIFADGRVTMGARYGWNLNQLKRKEIPRAVRESILSADVFHRSKPNSGLGDSTANRTPHANAADPVGAQNARQPLQQNEKHLFDTVHHLGFQ